MINPQLLSYDTKNLSTLIAKFVKKKENECLNVRKENKKLKFFHKSLE